MTRLDINRFKDRRKKNERNLEKQKDKEIRIRDLSVDDAVRVDPVVPVFSGAVFLTESSDVDRLAGDATLQPPLI